VKQYDMIVIGGGSGGLSAAYSVAQAGRRVALIDKGPVGGLCSLAGCNPKKVFVRASEVLDTVRRAGEHGVNIGEISIDWERVWRRKHSFTDPVPESTEKALAQAGIERVRAVARFIDEQTLVAGDEEYRAGAFVIATGSHPRLLDFPGAELLKTSSDVLELQSPPRRMVIVGAGVIALEFSHVFARLGTKVTMLMRGRGDLAGFDQDFSSVAFDFTRDHVGAEIVPSAHVTSVTSNGDSFRVELTRDGVTDVREAEFVLNAAGRDPAIEELDLAKANVRAGPRGVVVNSFLRSETNPRVFAGGDAHGRRQLSPVASYEGRVIARNFLEGNVREVDYGTIPQAIYITPPMASVGLTAVEAGHQAEVRASDMTKWQVYAIAGEPIARAKVVIDSGNGRILGAQLFGPAASENIHLFALAMQCCLTAEHLKEMVYAYPTFASTIQSIFV